MKYTIEYLGHSAFIVELDSYYLFFDYVGNVAEDGYTVEEKIINFDDYRDKKVMMFNSHDHFDHYDRDMHISTQEYENITSVLGDIESNFKNTITIKPREIKEIDSMKIYAGASTDLGVCYLIQFDGFTIYYGGDNADWGDGYSLNDIHYQEIDNFTSLGLDIDLAFIPICNFVGQRPASMTTGAIYSIKNLNPKVVVPMHSAGKDYLYKEFAKDVKNANCNNEIICMDYIGKIYKRS